MSIPQARVFTLADGRINFRACLEAARDFAERTRRKNIYGAGPTRSTLTIHETRAAQTRVAELVEAENARWAALSPDIRAAATLFDATLETHGLEARDAYGRDVAIEALADSRPAVWPTISFHPYATEINTSIFAVYGEGSSLTVFERLVAEERDFTATLFALNAAGAQFLRNARNARAYRRRPLMAAE